MSNPAAVGRDLGVNSGVVGVGAAISPGDNSALLAVPEEGAARVTLARVGATASVSSADLVGRDAAEAGVVAVASGLGDDRHIDLQQDCRCGASSL